MKQTRSEPCLEDQKTEVLEDKLLSELCSIETEEQPQKHSFEEVIAQHEVWSYFYLKFNIYSFYSNSIVISILTQ